MNRLLTPFFIPYEVQANEGTIASTTSTSATATTDLASVDGLSVSLDDGAYFPVLTWSTVTGATGYAVERKGGPGGDNWAIIGGAGGTGYADQQYVPGVTYNYEVVAYDDTNRSEPSSSFSISTLAQDPNVDEYASALALNNTTVALTWGLNSVDSGTAYSIVRYSGSTTTALATDVSPQTTSYIDTGLTPGTQYYYSIFATNSLDTDPAPIYVLGGVITPNFQESDHSWSGNSAITAGTDFGRFNVDAGPSDDATEYDAPDYIRLTRNGGNLDQPLTVSVGITGDGVYGTDYALAEPAGSTAAGNASFSVLSSGTTTTAYVSFNPGETSAIIEMDPLDVQARSGKQLPIAVESSPNYSLGTYDDNGNPIPYFTTETTAPHGLTITLGNNQQSQIISSDTPGDLIPVKVNLPTDLGIGGTVTLSTNTSDLGLYLTNAAGTTETPVSNPYVLTITSTTTTSATLFAGALNGDTTADAALVFAVTDPAAVSGYSTPPGQSIAAVPVTDVTLQIHLAYDANNTSLSPTADQTNQTIPWMVGQVAELSAPASGPPADIAGHHTYKWKVDGKIASDWPLPMNKSQIVPFSSVTGSARVFWISTSTGPSGPENDVVTVSIPGLTIEYKATFAVYTPMATYVTGPTPTTAYENVDNTTGMPISYIKADITYKADVTEPSQVNQHYNSWSVLQTVATTDSFTYATHSRALLYTSPAALDGGFPLHEDPSKLGQPGYYATILYSDGTVVNGPDGVTLPADGTQYKYEDDPSVDLTPPFKVLLKNGTTPNEFATYFEENQSFDNYIMFKPYAASYYDSEWVPLQSFTWEWSIKVKKDNPRNQFSTWSKDTPPNPLTSVSPIKNGVDEPNFTGISQSHAIFKEM